MLVWLVLLTLFDPLRAQAGNLFHRRNHTGLLTLFGFDDGQHSIDLRPLQARDYTGLNLLGNLTTSSTTTSWSASQVGISFPYTVGGNRAISQETTAGILSRLSTEFSVEMFMMSPNNPKNDVLIAGFGDWPAGSAFPFCEAGESDMEGGWRMFSSLGGGIRIQTVISENGSPSCVEVSFGQTPGTLRHSVFRGREGEVGVQTHDAYDRILDPIVAFNPLYWARHFSHLTLATPQPTQSWKGTIFMIAIYDRYLGDAEVGANRSFGLPNSWAVASTSALAVTEDVALSLFP